MKSAGLKISIILAGLSFCATSANAFIFQGTSQQRHDCGGDAHRLCGHHIPDVQRITSCMQRHVAQLTPACRRHFR
ncbi:hypothetical protein [Rhodoblastus sp.]|uniref:hypothetical protein n=1 Tax=Rhodoblastus sp. TaxID=1962975 RepID=UPI0035B1B44E